jgi:hypothetical protein
MSNASTPPPILSSRNVAFLRDSNGKLMMDYRGKVIMVPKAPFHIKTEPIELDAKNATCSQKRPCSEVPDLPSSDSPPCLPTNSNIKEAPPIEPFTTQQPTKIACVDFHGRPIHVPVNTPGMKTEHHSSELEHPAGTPKKHHCAESAPCTPLVVVPPALARTPSEQSLASPPSALARTLSEQSLASPPPVAALKVQRTPDGVVTPDSLKLAIQDAMERLKGSERSARWARMTRALQKPTCPPLLKEKWEKAATDPTVVGPHPFFITLSLNGSHTIVAGMGN